jgi:hypothetical protein
LAKRIPKEILARLKAVKAKRAKTVIDHLLKHGQITTEQLSELYGYDHPPRAIRDVREQGIPLERFSVKGKHGRTIAAYRFGDLALIKVERLGGRQSWPKAFKQQLVDEYGARCGICLTTYEPRYLQIDHRVPYEVVGDRKDTPTTSDYMLICGSCNRAKSWSCEHCSNWTTDHDVAVCQTCYWARPENHVHVALSIIRRVALTWANGEVAEYNQLVELSKKENQELPDFVKSVLRRRLGEEFGRSP